MKMTIRFWLIILFVLISANAAFAESRLYTAHNVWFEPGKETRLYCINYKTGLVIPAGTEVKDVKLTRSPFARGAHSRRQAITFVTAHDNRRYFVQFRKKFHPGKTIYDYMNTMFTEKPFTTLTYGLSQNEIDAIRKGSIVLGMSKRAVIISFGYPPEHYTPSLKYNIWTYWMNRFKSKKFYFDDNGETVFPVPMAVLRKN